MNGWQECINQAKYSLRSPEYIKGFGIRHPHPLKWISHASFFDYVIVKHVGGVFAFTEGDGYARLISSERSETGENGRLSKSMINGRRG